jgi:hypothetical protein
VAVLPVPHRGRRPECIHREETRGGKATACVVALSPTSINCSFPCRRLSVPVGSCLCARFVDSACASGRVAICVLCPIVLCSVTVILAISTKSYERTLSGALGVLMRELAVTFRTGLPTLILAHLTPDI